MKRNNYGELKVIGLTGKSGSGKSTIAKYLQKKYKAKIIDADKIGHFIIEKGNKAYEELVQLFGEGILQHNEEIDRGKLGEVVFNDEKALKKLSTITHYYICQEIEGQIKNIENNFPQEYTSIIVDAALLLDTHLKETVDEVWVVIADRDTRIERLVKRQSLPKEEIEKRLGRQSKDEYYKQFADEIIHCSNEQQVWQKDIADLYERNILMEVHNESV